MASSKIFGTYLVTQASGRRRRMGNKRNEKSRAGAKEYLVRAEGSGKMAQLVQPSRMKVGKIFDYQ